MCRRKELTENIDFIDVVLKEMKNDYRFCGKRNTVCGKFYCVFFTVYRRESSLSLIFNKSPQQSFFQAGLRNKAAG